MTNGFNFLIYKTPDKDVKVNAVSSHCKNAK